MAFYLNSYINKYRPSVNSLFIFYLVSFSYNFLSAQISSVIFLTLALACLVFKNNGGSKSYFQITWPLIVIFIIGTIGMSGHKFNDILRDSIYSLSSISLIYLGHWLAGRNIGIKLIAKSIVTIGIALALIHLSNFVLNPQLIGADLNTVTKASYVSGDLVVLALVLGVFQNRLKLGDLCPNFLSRKISLLLLFSSFALSYSRTEMVVFLVLTFAVLGYLHRVRGSAVILVTILISAYLIITTMGADDRSSTFIAKSLRSFTEVKVSNYVDFEDITYNWRGFETYRAIATYASGSTLQKMIGQGFGSLVNLGITMNLAGTDYDQIPVIHNGYAYVLLKTGWLGILLYMVFYIKIIYRAVGLSNTSYILKKAQALLLLGSVLCLVVTMYVVGGPPEAHSSELVLLLGYLSRRLWIERNIVT